MRKLLASSIFLLAIVIPNAVLAYTSPGQPTGFVNDFAGVFKPEEKSALEQKLSQFEESTKNEISVVTIQSLEGDSVENYAEKLFQEWGIGKEDEDNGVLLLVAIDDRKMRIEVGYGLEGSLTDILSSRIIRNTLTPAFKNGDFYGGIDTATDQMISIIGGNVPEGLDGSEQAASFDFHWLIYIFIGFIWLASILARSKSWWAGGVVGFIIGIIISLFFGLAFIGLISIIVLTPLGLLFDFIVSKTYKKSIGGGKRPPWWIGGSGFGGGSSSGGFGGFGSGSSGGGGSSGSW